jgi:uncharacterized BrkB/YihY/UPF0761 family membrane protein
MPVWRKVMMSAAEDAQGVTEQADGWRRHLWLGLGSAVVGSILTYLGLLVWVASQSWQDPAMAAFAEAVSYMILLWILPCPSVLLVLGGAVAWLEARLESSPRGGGRWPTMALGIIAGGLPWLVLTAVLATIYLRGAG